MMKDKIGNDIVLGSGAVYLYARDGSVYHRFVKVVGFTDKKVQISKLNVRQYERSQSSVLGHNLIVLDDAFIAKKILEAG